MPAANGVTVTTSSGDASVQIHRHPEVLRARGDTEWPHSSRPGGHSQSTCQCLHKELATGAVCSLHVWYSSPEMGLVRDVGTHEGNHIQRATNRVTSRVNPYEGCFVYSVIKG
jgi:hypothetical protein